MKESMTIQEVSQILGVNEDTIQHHVRNLYPGFMINGKKTFLSQEQVTEIKKRMQPTNTLVGAKTELEILEGGLQYIQWMQSKIQEQKAALEEAKPKVEFFDLVANSDGKRKIGDASKELKLLSPNKLFEQLRNDRILMGNNIPYQQYIDQGYFELSLSSKSGMTFQTPLVTNKGLIWLQKRYKDLIGASK
mgnify:CR=1 FL=1